MAYDQKEYDKLMAQRESLISQKRQLEERDLQNRRKPAPGGLTMSNMLGVPSDPYGHVVGGKASMDLNNQISDLYNKAQAINPNSAGGKAEAAWQEAMNLLQRQGPYTPEVVNQLTNRRADQTAAAEAVNAEEIRNQAAARGMDPTQAIRGLQQQRQAQNVAFSGDIASQAAVQNFAAETPGRMAAAQANLNRQFGGASTPAVQGGGIQMGAPRTAFASQGTAPRPQPAPAPIPAPKPGITPAPQRQPMSVAERNAAQAAWDQNTNYGRDVYGADHRPGQGGDRDSGGRLIPSSGMPRPDLTAPKPVISPAVSYGTTAFGPVSTAENARSYQNIYKYTK